MRFVYKSKYNPGDTVYQILRYVNETHIKERQVVGVVGLVQQKGGAVVKYELTPIFPHSQFFKECAETALYATREEAQAVADVKAADYIKRTRERYETELCQLEIIKRERIAGAIAEIEEEIKNEADFINRQLRGLK